MAYDNEITGGNLVTLGGYNTKTRQENPTKLEGYYTGVVSGPDKFNPGKTKNTYTFLTKEGPISTKASSDLDSKLKNAHIGRMTLIEFTGEKDTGKGNPQKLFRVRQDSTNVISAEQAGDVGGSSEDPSESDSYESEAAPAPKSSARVPLPGVSAMNKVAALTASRNHKSA